MNRDSEKTGYAGSLVDAVLTILAIVSVLVVLCAAALTAGGASWRIRAFFAVVSVLFDLVFVYEFMAKAGTTLRYSRFQWSCPGWLLFASSIPPFLLVSGPFLAGWMHADFSSAAVRGYWISNPPLGALATIAILRLLRVARPFLKTRRLNGTSRPGAVAAVIALSIVFLGAILADSLILPSWFTAWTTEHASTLAVLADMDIPTAQHMVETNPNILGAIAQGMVLKATEPGLMPTDFIALSDGSATIWFDAQQVHEARGMAELIAALAACAAAVTYGLGGRRNRYGSRGPSGSSDPVYVLKARTTPVGAEEIKGILGKHL